MVMYQQLEVEVCEYWPKSVPFQDLIFDSCCWTRSAIKTAASYNE
jgi:hypothetical protein